jgi:hypothetical protein
MTHYVHDISILNMEYHNSNVPLSKGDILEMVI